MAQSGSTPILLYHSTTASTVPSAANLAAGELALNIPDGKLYYNNAGTVELLASQSSTAGNFVTLNATGDTIIGNPGLEGNGVQVNGTTYEALLKVSNIGASTDIAQFLLHRHSTAYQPIIATTRSNSDTDSHAPVTLGMPVFTLYSGGSVDTTDNYAIFGGIQLGADGTGTIGTGSAPGLMQFLVTPDGSDVPNEYMAINNQGAVSFSGDFGTANYVLQSNGNAAPPTWVAPSSGGTPAGSNTQIQYNNSGSFGASANFTFDGKNVNNLATQGAFTVPATGGYFFDNSGNQGLYVENTSEFSAIYTAGAERLRVDSAGKLGLGTTTPAYNLDVYGATSVIGNSYTNANLLIGAYQGTTATTTVQGSAYINFATYNGSAFVENLRILSTGALSLGSTGTAYGTSGQVLTSAGSSASPTWTTPTTGTVTSVSVVSANGLAGSVATASSTPAITLSTTVTGILQGNGTAISAASTTGSGNVVLATSPTLVTPVLGTPTSGTLTNCTGLPTTGLTGTITNAQLANSTISGVSLGNNLNTLTIGSGLSGTSYNGSAAITIANTAPMVYPGAGIPNSTGSAWGTSYTTTGTGTVLALATSPTLVTPVLGTPTSGTLTNCTGLPVSSGISGLGTGVATALAVNTGTAGSFVVEGGALGTPSSGTLTNCTGYPASAISGSISLTTQVTGTLPVGNGGTGVATLTGLAYGNGTSAFSAATAAQVVGVIGTTAVTNATNAANVTLAAASAATNYVVMGGSATGNVAELTDTAFTFNAVNHVLTGGISGGGF